MDEQEKGLCLGLPTAALGLHWLLGHELRPGEQRLLWFQGLVTVAVTVGGVAVAQRQFDCRPDAACVVPVPIP